MKAKYTRAGIVRFKTRVNIWLRVFARRLIFTTPEQRCLLPSCDNAPYQSE